MLPSSATECCHLRRSPKGVQVSSTPEACAVGLGRSPVRAQGSKVRFADKPPGTAKSRNDSLREYLETTRMSAIPLRRDFPASKIADALVDRVEFRTVALLSPQANNSLKGELLCSRSPVFANSTTGPMRASLCSSTTSPRSPPPSTVKKFPASAFPPSVRR